MANFLNKIRRKPIRVEAKWGCQQKGSFSEEKNDKLTYPIPGARCIRRSSVHNIETYLSEDRTRILLEVKKSFSVSWSFDLVKLPSEALATKYSVLFKALDEAITEEARFRAGF